MCFPSNIFSFYYRALAFPLLKVCQALPLHLFSIGLITGIIFTKKSKALLGYNLYTAGENRQTHKHKKLVFLFLL